MCQSIEKCSIYKVHFSQFDINLVVKNKLGLTSKSQLYIKTTIYYLIKHIDEGD